MHIHTKSTGCTDLYVTVPHRSLFIHEHLFSHIFTINVTTRLSMDWRYVIPAKQSFNYNALCVNLRDSQCSLLELCKSMLCTFRSTATIELQNAKKKICLFSKHNALMSM